MRCVAGQQHSANTEPLGCPLMHAIRRKGNDLNVARSRKDDVEVRGHALGDAFLG